MLFVSGLYFIIAHATTDADAVLLANHGVYVCWALTGTGQTLALMHAGLMLQK